jgi:hypothetical protein
MPNRYLCYRELNKDQLRVPSGKKLKIHKKNHKLANQASIEEIKLNPIEINETLAPLFKRKKSPINYNSIEVQLINNDNKTLNKGFAKSVSSKSVFRSRFNSI